MASIADRIRTLIGRGNNKMSTSYQDLTSVVNNLIGGYNEASWIDLGTGTTFDVKKACLEYGVDYTSLTNDNFLVLSAGYVQATGGTCARGSTGGGGGELVKSYNASTGVLSCYVRAKFYTNGFWQEGAGWWDGTGPYYANGNTHVYLLLAKKASDAGSYADLGSGQSFDVKEICAALDINYKSLTADNFAITNASTFGITLAKYISDNYAPTGSTKLVKSYNADTGILTAYVNTYISWVHMDGSSKSVSVNGNVHAELILATKAGYGDITDLFETRDSAWGGLKYPTHSAHGGNYNGSQTAMSATPHYVDCVIASASPLVFDGGAGVSVQYTEDGSNWITLSSSTAKYDIKKNIRGVRINLTFRSTESMHAVIWCPCSIIGSR